jgi:DNA-binding transcriptional ArsR family regulator
MPGELKEINKLKIDNLTLKKASLVLRAINHKLRQQILRLLDDKQKMTVTEIFVYFRLEQSVISQHLTILRRAGFVTTERQGKFIYYYVNYDRIDQMNKELRDLLSF